MSAAPAGGSRSFRLLLLLTLIPLLAPWSRPAHADAGPVCGPGRLAFEGGPDLTFTTPAAAFNCRGWGANPESAAYDVPAGWLSVGDSCLSLGTQAHASVTEAFTLTGVAPGTPISFNARFHLVGGLDFWLDDTSTQAQLKVGLLADAVGDSSYVTFGAGQEFRAVDIALSVPLVRPAGEPFEIVYELIAGGSYRGSSATGVARFEFVGLPPGVAIHSCRGYTQDTPTPARPTSWGGVKAQYR